MEVAEELEEKSGEGHRTRARPYLNGIWSRRSRKSSEGPAHDYAPCIMEVAEELEEKSGECHRSRARPRDNEIWPRRSEGVVGKVSRSEIRGSDLKSRGLAEK